LFLVRDPRGTFQVKVLDFGIAKVMDAAGGMGHKTRTGVLLGTPGYMSPEQIKNAKGVDPRSDLWSIGIIFYEMLTGTQAFEAGNEFARLTAVLTEEMKPIERVRPDLAAWSAFFRRALMKDPAQRFQTAEEMAHAVMHIARGGTLTSTPQSGRPPPSEWQQAVAPFAPPAGSPAPARIGSTPPPQPHYPTPIQPTHASATKRAGSPAMSSTPAPTISVIDAPPLTKGAPYWLVTVIAIVCLGIGVAVGMFMGGKH